MTAAAHANTVRRAMRYTRIADPAAHRAIDTLEAQAESKGAAGWARAMKRAAELERRAEAAEADRDRLADALRKIADGRWNVGAAKDADARTFARAALAETERTPEHEAASPLYRQERDRWLSECSCGWEQETATCIEARMAWANHKSAMDEQAARAALAQTEHTP